MSRGLRRGTALSKTCRLGAAAVLAIALAACGGGESEGGGSASAPTPTETATARPSESAQPQKSAQARPELPRGGREVFPAYRLVGYAGRPGIEALGRLGIGDLDERVDELERRARPYAGDRTVMPVLELIATMATTAPGEDGQFRERAPDSVVREHLAAARRHDALLLIGIQPGRADFADEVKHYERWLKEPDVGVALDPEWAVDDGQVPGEEFGRTSGRELDSVARYLSRLVEQNDLPEKVMVVHQLHVDILEDEADWEDHPGVVAIKSVDGIGSRQMKLDTNRVLTRDLRHVHPGFKLFFEEDRRHGELMTPEQVMAIRPRPVFVMYE